MVGPLKGDNSRTIEAYQGRNISYYGIADGTLYVESINWYVIRVVS